MENCFHLVILSAARRPLRLAKGTKGKSKDPEKVSSAMPCQGVSTKLSSSHSLCCKKSRRKGRKHRRELPETEWAEDRFSGCFDAPSLSRYAGSFGLAQHDKPEKGWSN
jgi:hypothetical protein